MNDYSKYTDVMINREIAIRKGLIARNSDTFHNSALMVTDYASDLNAAAELLREMETSLEWNYGNWRVEITYHPRYVTHENPARAIAEAWLAWKEAAETS